MARGLKRFAERALCASGLAAVWERRGRPATIVLAYHNIVPSGEPVVGEASLHVDQKAFADHLDLVLEGRDVVPLNEVLDPNPRARPPRTRVVITFDDAYAGAMTAGLEEVAKRGLPATVFVPPGLLGSAGFWWDRLASATGGLLDSRVRAHALTALEGKTDRVLEWARAEGLGVRDMPEYARPVTADALLSTRLPVGVALAAHTWSHPNLVTLVADEMVEELEHSRAWLSQNAERFSDWLAYPYGAHDAAAVETAERLFEGAVLVEGGAAARRGRNSGAAHRVPRVNMPRGLSLEGLSLRLSGLLETR